MSDQEHESPIYEEMPRFTSEHKDFVVKVLAVTSVMDAVSLFLAKFEEFDDPKYGDSERIHNLIYYRLRAAKYDKNRPMHAEILELKKEIEGKGFDINSMKKVSPLTNPLSVYFKMLAIANKEKSGPTQFRQMEKILRIGREIWRDDVSLSSEGGSEWGDDHEFMDEPIGTAHRNANELQKKEEADE